MPATARQLLSPKPVVGERPLDDIIEEANFAVLVVRDGHT